MYIDNHKTLNPTNTHKAFIGSIICAFAAMFIFSPNQAASQTATKTASQKASSKKPIYTPNAVKFLGTSLWRTSECEKEDNYQTFIFNPKKPLVEVGYGKKGEGEGLELLHADTKDGFVEIETRVCAPVGCNHTVERYKILNQNQIMEWDFAGLLPNEPPNVVVKDGMGTRDGLKGRTFNRCAK